MITVNELFSGIGTQSLAFKYLGVPHKVVGMAEIEKNAIKAYEVLHGETKNYGDVGKVDELDYADLWTYSFPCFTGDTRVLTSDGYRRIDEIQVGMEVYTHEGRLKRVVKTFDNGIHPIVIVQIDGTPSIKTTANHKFLIHHNGSTSWKCIGELKRNWLSVVYDINERELDNNLDSSDLRVIKSLQYTSELERVYDIEVEDDHSFLVEGVCVHNCQDLSSAGKGKGLSAYDSDGNRVATRSGLLWEVERLLARSCGFDIEKGVLKSNAEYIPNPPKYLLLENVPELVNRKNHMANFSNWLDRLEELGYKTTYSILNGGNFGVPQNRERVFCVSIRRDVYSGDFDFPQISDFNLPISVGFDNFVDKEVRDYKGPLMIDPAISNYLLPAYTRDLEDIARCSEDIFSRKDIWTCKCNSGFQDHRIGIKWAPTIRHQNQHTAIFFNNQIHKLTASECWKFMGIKEKDFWHVKNETGISDTILCGLAGNAIVVPVLMSIFNQIALIESRGYPLTRLQGDIVPFLTINPND